MELGDRREVSPVVRGADGRCLAHVVVLLLRRRRRRQDDDDDAAAAVDDGHHLVFAMVELALDDEHGATATVVAWEEEISSCASCSGRRLTIDEVAVPALLFNCMQQEGGRPATTRRLHRPSACGTATLMQHVLVLNSYSLHILLVAGRYTKSTHSITNTDHKGTSIYS